MGQKIKVIWSGPAKRDLRAIYNFLAQESETAAEKVINKIVAKAENLQNSYLKSGQKELLLENTAFEYHYLIQGNYKIIYRAFPDKAEIATVFDTRQNPDKLPSKV